MSNREDTLKIVKKQIDTQATNVVRLSSTLYNRVICLANDTGQGVGELMSILTKYALERVEIVEDENN